jgi:hypothetical protein
MSLIGFLIFMLEPMAFQAKYTLEQVPLDSEFYLQIPVSATRDNKGRHYILDQGANTIFMWDADGSYIGTLGRPGTGPGELSLRWKLAKIRSFEDRIYVMDALNQRIHYFKDFEFQKTYAPRYGRPRKMEITSDGNFVMEFINFGMKPNMIQVWLLSPEFEQLKLLDETPDQTWERNSEGGWTYTYFAKEFMLYTHPDLDYILLGNSQSPTIQKISPNGHLIERVTYAYRREPFPESLKDNLFPKDFLSNARNKVKFPELLPYHWTIFTNQGKTFTFNLVGPEVEVKAYVLDGSKAFGVYTDTLGSEGALFPLYPEIAKVHTNSDGEFVIEVGDIKAASGLRM